jgi:hypothetical protein
MVDGMNLDELEALAKKATPGPWKLPGGGARDPWQTMKNDQYHTACSPDRILALVRVARAADRVVQQTTAARAYALHDELIGALRALEEKP